MYERNPPDEFIDIRGRIEDLLYNLHRQLEDIDLDAYNYLVKDLIMEAEYCLLDAQNIINNKGNDHANYL